MKFESASFWVLVPVFVGAAIAVWLAGTRLVRFADGISGKTGIGQAAIAGMLERRDRTFLRMGYDSIAVILTYAAGLVLLYGQR